jgi:cytochrome c biogenesis protein CcmG/thiol:disulfide interchange protein DsbE
MSGRGLITIGLLALVSLTSACGAEETRSAAPIATKASGDPLGQLEAEQNQLLDGGKSAFTQRLAELRGHPVVVNQWASWCAPCRFEFPFFRDQAEKLRGRVAFLGVNSRDKRGSASAFLSKLPVPFPHFYDEDTSIARLFRGGRAWPTTAFYKADGKLVFTHMGAYASEDKLAEDIERYVLSG